MLAAGLGFAARGWLNLCTVKFPALLASEAKFGRISYWLLSAGKWAVRGRLNSKCTIVPIRVNPHRYAKRLCRLLYS